MLCKCHWIVLYTVHFTAFCLGGPFFPGHGVERIKDVVNCTMGLVYIEATGPQDSTKLRCCARKPYVSAVTAAALSAT